MKPWQETVVVAIGLLLVMVAGLGLTADADVPDGIGGTDYPLAQVSSVCGAVKAQPLVASRSPQTIDYTVGSLACPVGTKLTVEIVSYRYWVSSKVWLPERSRTYDFTGSVPVFTEAFHCNVVGALMADRVIYRRLVAGKAQAVWRWRASNSALCLP